MGASTPAYNISKVALNALTRMLAAELRESGISVNAVDPGWVATDMGGRGGRSVENAAAGVVWGGNTTRRWPDRGLFLRWRARSLVEATGLVAALALAGCGGTGSEGSGSNSAGGEVETSPSGQSESGGSDPSEPVEGTAAEGPQAEAAQCYVDAVNTEDLDALVGCFDPGATVVDVGRRIEDRQAIREWATPTHKPIDV